MRRWVEAALYPPARCSAEALAQHFGGTTVVVTGASRGIGEAVARALYRVAARVVLIARSEERLRALAEEARSAGCAVEGYAVDLREREALEELCLLLADRLPRVDYLFANAGKSIRRSLEQSRERGMHDFDRTLDLNYRSVVHLTQALFPALQAAGGRVIYTSSVSLLYPPAPLWAAYHASKAATDVWLRTARHEWAHHGVQVRIAYMPLVHTQMSHANPRYVHLPGYTAEGAAHLLLRLAQGRRLYYIPWWARLTAPIARALEGGVGLLYRHSLL